MARRTPDKFDAAGNYLPFYGYSVVSNVSDRLGMGLQWEEFIRSSRLLSAHISPLPASSYHLTVYDLFTQREVPQRYAPKSGLVPSPLYRDALSSLREDSNEAQKLCEEFDGDLTFQKESLDAFVNRLPRGALLVCGTLADDKKIRELAEQIRDSFHGVGKFVPAYHITLGYVFKEIPQGRMNMVKKELTELWKLVSSNLYLDKPNVCYFDSMTEFTPVKSILL